jgi:hypothetical protein
MERETVEVDGHPETLFAFLIRYLLRVHVRLESHWTYRQIVGLAPRFLAYGDQQKLSSIHRYICNRANWLYEITQTQKIKPSAPNLFPFLVKE